MYNLFRSLLVFISFLFVQPIQATETLDRIMAIVNNDVITQSQLDKQVLIIKHQMTASNYPIPSEPQLHKEVLEELINNKLQLQEAKTRGIDIDNEKINSVIEGIAKQNHIVVDQLRTAIEAEGINYAEYRQQIRESMTLSMLREQELKAKMIVTDAQVAEYIKSHAKQKLTTQTAKRQLLNEKFKDEMKNWIAKLRSQAYIKIQT